MSLIFGVCLPRKIYLVSDSRLTTGSEFQDDFAKWLDLNPRLAVVAGNNAHEASWLLRKIAREVRENGWDWDFTNLESYLRVNLKDLAREYYAETGEVSRSVGFIFGGFEKNKKLEIESARMGDTMSAPVQQAGEGVRVEQSVDMDIINAFRPLLEDASREGRSIEAGTLFEVDLPKPRVLAVTVKATDDGPEVVYEDAACFDGVVFNPKYQTERVELPSDLIGNLVYRDQSKEKNDDMVYVDYGHIILYVKKLLREKKWPTVGGEVLPLLVTPDSSGFAIGKYIRKVDGGSNIIGGIGEVEGKMHYYDSTGKLMPYRFIYNFLDEAGASSESKL